MRVYHKYSEVQISFCVQHVLTWSSVSKGGIQRLTPSVMIAECRQ